MPITIYPGTVKKRNANGTYSDLIPGADAYASEIEELQDIAGDGQLSGFTATDLTGAANELKNTLTQLDTDLDAEVATRQTYVRPNLLDNWYFVNPVNQRGQTSYVSGYTIDRWYCSDSMATIQLGSSGLTMTSKSQYAGFIQYIEERSIAENSVLTLSAIAGNDLYSFTFTATKSQGATFLTNWLGNENLYTYFNWATTKSAWELYLLDNKNATEETVTIKAVKLELGSGQTLAHNEGTGANPVWVLNEIPDYGEQMYKCCASTADLSDTYANTPYDDLAKVESSTSITSASANFTIGDKNLKKQGKVVYLSFNFVSTVDVSGYTQLGTIPAEFRPSGIVNFIGYAGQTMYGFYVASNGIILNRGMTIPKDTTLFVFASYII